MSIQSFRAEEARKAAEQETINQVFAAQGAEVAEAVIRQSATLAHAQYPQYHGKFAAEVWFLGRCTQTIETKGGVRFVAGDVVLMRYERSYFGMRGETTAYSVRGAIECSVGYGVEPLQGWAKFFRAAS